MNEILLAARDLEFGYAGNVPVVNDVTMSFAAGSTTAIVGRSGRGKSTLLYLLGLMLRPARGEIDVCGVASSGLRDNERAALRAEKFGFVFQDAALDLTRTVLDNVTEVSLYRGALRNDVETRARELLERFGVDVPPDRKPGQISGGQAQRIALCRALLFAPQVLLADEPTGNLDPQTADLVIEALTAQARSGSAVVVVTHSPALAQSCDAVVQL